MKRFLVFCLSALLVAMLAACGSKTENTSPQIEKPDIEETIAVRFDDLEGYDKGLDPSGIVYSTIDDDIMRMIRVSADDTGEPDEIAMAILAQDRLDELFGDSFQEYQTDPIVFGEFEGICMKGTDDHSGSVRFALQHDDIIVFLDGSTDGTDLTVLEQDMTRLAGTMRLAKTTDNE